MKTCRVIGPRILPANRRAAVERELRAEILQAIDAGCTRFQTRCEWGTDLLFARLVVEQMATFPQVRLEVVKGAGGNAPDADLVLRVRGEQVESAPGRGPGN